MVVDVFVLFVGAGVFIVIGFDVCVWVVQIFDLEKKHTNCQYHMMGSFTTGIFKSY